MASFLYEHSVKIVFLTGVIFVVFWLFQFRKRLHMNTVSVLSVSLLCMLLGYFSLVVFAALESITTPGSRAKYSLFGAVFIMPILFLIGAKKTNRKVTDVFDILAIPMIIALFCARVNCLATGCCYGRAISGTNGLHWPTREIELVYYLVFTLFFAPKVLKNCTKGEVYPWYMLSYGILRFFLETFRVSGYTNNLFHLSHLWAIISFCIGAAMLMELNDNSRRRK